MKFKVLLAIFALLASVANAAEGKYTLSYQQQNKWVSQKDIKPLRNAVVFFQNNNLKIKATCNNADNFCRQRVDIINKIFKKQKVKNTISIVEKSKFISTNKIVIGSINLDKNKYSSLLINYKNKEILPVKKSQTDVASLIKYSELKYLSKFKMYCKNVDTLCKNRFKTLNTLFSKLTFKYNFALYKNENLTENQVQLVAHRHNYNVSKPVTTAKKEAKKTILPVKKIKKKATKLKYSKEKNIIVFKENSADLLILEKVKIENLIINSKTNKFDFACGEASAELCKKRIHAIKDYALKNTSNIIEMNEFKHDLYKDHILILDKE